MSDDIPADLRRILGSRLSAMTWQALEDEVAEGQSPALRTALRTLVDLLRERDRDLRWHQEELEETNTGLLALHAEIDQQREETAFLDEVSRASAASLNRRTVLDEMAELLLSHGFADRTTVWTTAEHGLACAADPQLEPDSTTQNAVQSRESTRDGDSRVSVPLTTGTHVLGVFDLHRDSSGFTDDDLALANGIANRVATGLRNADEYEREHELAARLQRAMLPTLTTHPDLDIVARYRSPTHGVHVGGDWYDVVERPDGSMVLTVGDVTGHGVDAAVVMGQLQNTLRAYAMEGHAPAHALQLVHEMLRHSDTSLFATAVMVEMHPDEGIMRWASAGHPPPLVHTPSGTVDYLFADHAPMLGIHTRSREEIPQHERRLVPGTAITLFTDGLIEHRASDIDAGMQRLVDTCRGCSIEEMEARADHILSSMLHTEYHDDDVCLLMFRWRG